MNASISGTEAVVFNNIGIANVPKTNRNKNMNPDAISPLFKNLESVLKISVFLRRNTKHRASSAKHNSDIKFAISELEIK